MGGIRAQNQVGRKIDLAGSQLHVIGGRFRRLPIGVTGRSSAHRITRLEELWQPSAQPALTADPTF